MVATGPTADSLPGTYWSLQNALPPLPFDLFPELPVYVVDPTNGVFLVDDRSVDFAALQAQQQAQAQTMTADFMGPPMPGDGSDEGTNLVIPEFNNNLLIDYGTNLWIANFALSANNAVGILSNSVSDVLYEIQYQHSLGDTQWLSGGFVVGSEVTNWTGLVMTNVSGTNNAFFRIRSWADDGSGLPIWWQLQYFGTTGIDPNSQDWANDGWTMWQDFVGGYNPLIFHTPSAPTGLAVTYNSSSATAMITWLPSLGPVTGYTVKKHDQWTGQTANFYFSTNVHSFLDTISDGSGEKIDPVGLDAGPTIPIYYQIQAHYAGGDSAWSNPVLLEPNYSSINIIQASLPVHMIAGPQGSAYLAASGLPPGTVALRVKLVDEFANYYWGDASFDTSVDIPISALTNGLCLLPSALTAPPADSYGMAEYWWFVQTVDANNNPSEPMLLLLTYSYTSRAVPAYLDGRVHMKQNLIFLLRAATVDLPFSYVGINTNTDAYGIVAYPSDYAYSDFGSDVFSDNYLFRNFVLNPTNLDVNGRTTTGAGGNYSGNNWDWKVFPGGLLLLEPPLFQLQTPEINGASIPAMLATNQTEWLATYALDSATTYLGEIGISYNTNTGVYSMAGYARNIYGLTFLSVNIGYNAGNGAGITTLYANHTTTQGGCFYPQTAQPLFQKVEYDFWNNSPLPASINFSTSQTSDLLIAGADSSINIAGYAKLAVLNGYSGVYAYLGQYFDQAYKITNSVVTTNTTGLLSPYGNFFATEPGPVALVTMPDTDTGALGTCTVYCVSLQLDANHDGNMDLSFNSPDATSVSSPYVFWTDRNYDRLSYDADDSTNYEDDVKIASNPGTSVPQSDCNYSNRVVKGRSFRAIPTKRDLEDFARLWVAGIDTNLIAKLPSGSTITLSWADDFRFWPNVQAGNPTIDLFAAADADGGIGYLTNETTAATQTNIIHCPYIGRLGPGGSIQLNTIQFADSWAGNHFIWCGVSDGSGCLLLTIADANGNVLGQASAWIKIVDIKQMYERWTVGDNPAKAPTNTPVLVTDGLAAGMQGFRYTAPADTNTPYILFVHGWNMEPWEKDRFAETAFKRLYWQGYQGRFGEFRWPTDYDFAGWKSVITDPDNFDNSEFQAWKSGVGLLALLNNLNALYPGHVYMFAHSMGNVVAGEALRQAGNTQLVNTYVAMQAALASHAYDPTTPTRSLGIYDSGTPNRYAQYYTNGAANYFHGLLGAGTYVNFFNTNDFALSKWQIDQNLKPDVGYSYQSSIDTWWQIHPILNTELVFPQDTYEIFSYGDEARCYALGAQQDVGGVFTPASQVELDAAPYGFGSQHLFHSFQFRLDNAQSMTFWHRILIKFGLVEDQ